MAAVVDAAAGVEAHEADDVRLQQVELQHLRAALALKTHVWGRLVADAHVPGPGEKVLYFVRHGEGEHNVAQREWRAAGMSGEPYTVDHDPDLSGAAVLAVVALHAVGYWTFRGANSEKDAFRTDPLAPAVAHLEYLPTERGTKLLTSGWWGAARKINYAGDWLMGLSWCLLCGAGSVLPYFYAIYFGVLLVHRAIRDDGMCAAKYGKDWEKYKAKVPYVFVPGVF